MRSGICILACDKGYAANDNHHLSCFRRIWTNAFMEYSNSVRLHSSLVIWHQRTSSKVRKTSFFPSETEGWRRLANVGDLAGGEHRPSVEANANFQSPP